MTRLSRSPRRAVAALALAALCLLATPGLGFGQESETETATALLSQDGWWNRAQGPQSGEPDNPTRPIIGGVVPTPHTVPATAIAVGAALGDPDKVTAIGIVLEAPPDALVDSLVLKLKESADPGATANATDAKIIACPITTFWAGVKNGEFVGRPTCDDSQAVEGKRAADGTWTFDLALLASAWLDPESELQQNGVLLTEAVAAPVSFQVSFGDISTGTATTEFAATGGGFSGSSDFEFEEFAADEGGVGTTFEDAPLDADSGSFDSGSASFDSAAAPSAAIPSAPGDAQVAQPAARVNAPANLFGNLPPAAIVLLVLLMAGAGLALALVLGPMAEPTAAGRARSGGVSRALAARQAARR